MARGFQIFGEFIVEVSGNLFLDKEQLGLTVEPARVVPRYNHREVVTDDFGPDVPVEILFNMADAIIYLSLVHYDSDVLDKCMRAAMGGGGADSGNSDGDGAMDGFMGPAGRPLGFARALGTAANFFTTVYLTPADDATIRPYRFKACYLNSHPFELPYGTARSIAKIAWKCIPYQQLTTSEIASTDGVALWDRTSDLLT